MSRAASFDNPGRRIAGIDEVGRGCIAGPVVAAAVILNPSRPIAGLADSKTLSANKRMALAAEIKTNALCWAVGRAEASEIDRINILQATFVAMQRAFAMLAVQPDYILVDGNRMPPIACDGEAVIGGDAKIAEISAASILAKVARDSEMQWLDRLYPGYQFAMHKGYPTQTHRAVLAASGVTPHHRRSYAPVKKFL
ncbi:MAG: ribonuclease HII [Methylomonas sp.]|nr:ribonuclease HII [Methylomonas sp.]PPD21054.1 MAG: ribonuclease HII [Methylomonas sp.]PPD27080.1 MAG: ribonuclease HII [Methylomonas sp.]PPD38510.1 MAG: ribonuclease HII [Methylomonas sp.]PPD39012.1 MAG: ribonuclease HII [Methylomonas sp.]